MTQIIDVSPSLFQDGYDINRSVTGRMLSIVCSPDGKVLYAGSYSNLWCSLDGGQTWEQLSWPQPDQDEFDVPGALGGWCALDIAVALGWRVDKHPRFLAKLTKSGFADILGFGDCGVWTALGNGDGSFRLPNVVIANFGYQAGGWQLNKHPRFVVDLDNDGCADIVGFGDDGVWTAMGNDDGTGTFQDPKFVVEDFGYNQDWRVDKHPRFLAVTTKSGFLDIVGFGDAGVYIAFGNGDGTFDYQLAQQPVWPDLGYNQDWRVDKHPRFVTDINGDGYADIVGFGGDGVYVVRSNGDRTFAWLPGVPDFGYDQGWRVDRHPRFLADLTGKGQPSIVGFGDAGVYAAWNNDDGTGTFSYDLAQQPVWPDLGYNQDWRVDKHPRFVTDITGDGRADFVGFGGDGVYVVRNNGDGTFAWLPGVPDFGYDQGWRMDRHPRFLADLTGKGQPSIVGFGDAGVYTARNNDDGSGTFSYDLAQQPVIPDLGYNQGWREDRQPRFVTDINGDGRADIVGFGDAGVWTALADSQGGFPTWNFVLANFGYGTMVLALMAADRAANGQVGSNQVTGSRGIWRSTDGGLTWQLVHQFPGSSNPRILNPNPPNPTLGQLEWALGSDHLVYAAGGTCLAISKNAGQTFENAFPWDRRGPFGNVNHVAVWQNAPSDLFPAVIYALGQDAATGNGTMFVSLDGGTTWMRDKGPIPANIGGPTNATASSNSPKVIVISPRDALEVFVAQNGSSGSDVLNRGDYSHFLPGGDQISSWDVAPLPDALNSTANQDSGNVFLAVTKRGRGDLLFYGGQRYFQDQDGSKAAAFVGPLNPESSASWQRLDGVHMDLHGFLLSPDFEGSIKNGHYHPSKGMVWVLSDGGIYRSSDGGQNFVPADKATTLGCLSVAGVAVPGKPPALALNSGDNGGFYSMDGGQSWTYLDYNGGDNDCAFADPLRPNTILVFSPRRAPTLDYPDSYRQGQTVSVYQTDPGKLPDASSSGNDLRNVTGPPCVPDSIPLGDAWNATGGDTGSFGSPQRGFRPIVQSLPGEAIPPQGDYIFVLLNQEILPKDDNGNPLPLLVRTQRILEITSREEWVPGPNGLGPGGKVFQQGPPLPGLSLHVVQASGGHFNTVFYVGGDTTLWTWTNGATDWTQLLPTPANAPVQVFQAMRFFVSPYNPNLIYVLDVDAVKRSDDGGQTWQSDQSLTQQLTWNGRITISDTRDTLGLSDKFEVLLTDMQFDPNYPQIRFAIGVGGVFLTIDGGVTWTRLLHTEALPGRPSSCYYDWISESAPSLYVAFAGRSLLKITDLLLFPIV